MTANDTNRERFPAARRFVVLRHEKQDDVHWDLMLETDDILATWAISPPPRLDAFRCAAVRLPDHRRHYLDYEGPISDDRGSVRRIDAGTFETTAPGRFRLRGSLLDGMLAIDMQSGVVEFVASG